MSTADTNPTPVRAASALAIAGALAIVYVVWGSTYLAIRIVVQTLPPLSSAGVRFVVAGSLLLAWQRWRGVPWPTWRQWRAPAFVGVLLLLGGNGAVVFAETLVDSNIAALLVAMVPLWMVVLSAVLPGQTRPRPGDFVGLALGLFGVWVLIRPGMSAVGGTDAGVAVHPLGAALLVFASLSWSYGSLYSRTAAMPSVPALSTALQMLAGGAALLLVGAALGEWGRTDPGAWSLASLGAMAYLVVFGSLVAFSAYVWLLRVAPPALVGTYAFVNPVIAVVLGWFGGEHIGPSTLAALGLIVAAVGVTSLAGKRLGKGTTAVRAAPRPGGGRPDPALNSEPRTAASIGPKMARATDVRDNSR